MLSNNEYVIWNINNGSLRIAVGICNQTEFPIVYLKDLKALEEDDYNCYSYYEAPLTTEQAKEITYLLTRHRNHSYSIKHSKYITIPIWKFL